MSCAHKTLPMKILSEATYEGRTAIVIASDLRPYIEGSVTGLSVSAFESVAPLNKGVSTISYLNTRSISWTNRAEESEL